MAATEINTINLSRNYAMFFPTLVAVDATDGASINQEYIKDEKLLIIVENAHASTAKTVTVKAGNGPMAAAADLEFSLNAGQKRLLNVESGMYDNDGEILIFGSDANIKVAAVQLP